MEPVLGSVVNISLAMALTGSTARTSLREKIEGQELAVLPTLYDRRRRRGVLCAIDTGNKTRHNDAI